MIDEIPETPKEKLNSDQESDSAHPAEKRECQQRTGLDSLKRDFFRRLRKASFVLEMVGVFVVGAYTFQACRANSLARETLETTERAYVTLGRSDGTLMKWQSLDPGKVGAVTIYFQNAGNTAASNFYAQAELGLPEDSGLAQPCKYASGGTPDIFTTHIHGGLPKGEILIKRIVAAHSLEKIRAITRNPLSVASAQCIKDGRSRVTVEGVFEYDDIFGGYCCQNFAAAYLPEYGFLSLPPFRDNCPKLPKSTCDHNAEPPNQSK